MKKFLLACALLAGCSGNVGEDSYTFDQREWNHPAVTVTPVYYNSLEALHTEAIRRRLKPEGGSMGEIFAFSEVYRNNQVCRIHMVKPEVLWAPQAWGHELGHCLYGHWHKNEPVSQTRSPGLRKTS